MPRTAVLIPCYKRPEYTQICMEAIQNAQGYEDTVFYLIDEGGNRDILEQFKRSQDVLSVHKDPIGLRNSIIEFFDWTKQDEYDYISKVDNDCIVPRNWLNDLIKILETTDAQIISPNVSETNAAIKYGLDDTYDLGFRRSHFVGGLWTMQADLIDNIMFERADTSGIRGAFPLLHQIITLNDPKPLTGWTTEVTFDDIGYWGGSHPKHIKSEEHAMYSAEVGRPVGWNVEACK